MTEVKVPHASEINSHLLEDEELLDWVYSNGGPGHSDAFFYATDKRLIKYKNSLIGKAFGFFSFGTHFFDVWLHRISSITFHSYRPLPFIIIGIIGGLVPWFFGIFFFLLPPPHPAYSGPDVRVVGVIFFLLGLFFAGMFCRIKFNYHQINIGNANKKELKEWRIVHFRKGKKEIERIESFVTMMQDKMSQGLQSEPIPQKAYRHAYEPKKRVSGHLQKKCSNCNAILEPDDKFCPECGTPITGES